MDNKVYRNTDPQKNPDNPECLNEDSDKHPPQVILDADDEKEISILLDPLLRRIDPALPICLSQSSEPTVPFRTTSVGDFILL